jgi:hypothetical protein
MHSSHFFVFSFNPSLASGACRSHEHVGCGLDDFLYGNSFGTEISNTNTRVHGVCSVTPSDSGVPGEDLLVDGEMILDVNCLPDHWRHTGHDSKVQ